MKKIKFLLLALVATISMGAWAQEWTDVTKKMVNPSFETDEGSDDLTGSTTDVIGWTKIQDNPTYSQWGVAKSSCKIQGIAASMSTYDGGNYYYIRCNWNSTVDYGIYQEIKELPAGMYKLTYKAVTNSGDWNKCSHTVSLIENREDLPNDIASSKTMFSTGANWTEFETWIYKASEESTLTIKVNMTPGNEGGSQHYQILVDDFRLYYCEDLNASESNKIDLTAFISNPSIMNTNVDFIPRGWSAGNRAVGNSHYTEGTNNTQLEAWSGGNMFFDYYQELYGLPNGVYTLSAKCHDTDNKGGYLYTSTASATKTANMQTDYSTITTEEINVTDGKLRIGIKAEQTNGGSWMTGDDFELKFLGIDLSGLAAELASVRETAKAIIDANKKMNADILDALTTIYNDTEIEPIDAESYATAILNVNQAISDANESIAIYESIMKWYEDAEANLTEEGYNSFLTETSSIKTAYDNGTITDGVAENATLKSIYDEHMAKYYKPGSDITDVYIQNANLLNGKDGWDCVPNTYSDNFAQENNGHIGVLEFYAGWGSLTLTSYKMTQDITLPAGEYKLSSNAFFRYGQVYDTDKTKSEAYMVCGTNRTLLPTLGSITGSSYADNRAQAIEAFEKGLYETSTSFKLLEKSSVTIGYSGTFSLMRSWFISGPLKLVYVGPVSLEGYIDDLEAALATVPEDKMQKSFKDALDAAVDAANAILTAYEADPTSVTAKVVNDACEALRTAIINAGPSIALYKQIAEINAKAETLDEAGQAAYAATLAAYENGELETLEQAMEGFKTAVKAQTTVDTDWSALGTTDRAGWTGAVGTGNYATNYVEVYAGDNTAFNAGNVLTQTIKGLMPYAKYEVQFTAVANVARNLSASNYGEGIAQVFANDYAEDITVNNQSSCAPADDKYQYTLECYADGEGNLTFGLKNKKQGGQWYVAQFTSLTLKALAVSANMTIGSAQWGTFFAPFDVTLPEGAFAYAITINDSKTVRHKVAEGYDTENNVIPANTAVLVYSATPINENFNGAPTSTLPEIENALVGTLEPIASGNAPDGAYYLAVKDDVLNFYPAGQAKLAANRAYLMIPAGAKVEGLFDDVITGIDEVHGSMFNAQGSKYSIEGVRVNENYKGIVIENGKKYLKK
ncbi:MAG: DUF5013 domain-containing protein [Prevotellaceae bacterium]|nr:DUF5013 domain-containing protein [Prevotellaceae bacterium]